MITSRKISAAVQNTVPAQSSTGKSDCHFCKPQGFKFLPLRYAVVTGVDDRQAADWPPLQAPLGMRVTDKPLKRSRYTVRLLREGFVYVLIERQTGLEWQGYAVTAEGFLSIFPVGNPPPVVPTFSCDLAIDGPGASLISIPRIKKVKAIYVLFSPDVISMPVLEKLQNSRAGMQVLRPQQWKGQAHTLNASELSGVVAEFRLGDADGAQSKARTSLQQGRALYPLLGGPGVNQPRSLDQHRIRLQKLAQQLQQEHGPAIVLWDPIGIAHELNFHHRRLDEQIEQQMKPHEWKLETSHRIAMLETAVRVKAAEPPPVLSGKGFAAAKIGTNPEYLRYEKDPQGWVKQNQNTQWQRYASRYDECARSAFLSRLDAELKALFSDVELRFADLKAWLNSASLLQAFDHYDAKDVRFGLLCEYQLSLCTYGLATSVGGEALLRAWALDIDIRQNNLMARQMLLNQTVSIAEFRQAAKALQGKEDVETDQLQSMVSNISGVFDKAETITALAVAGRVPVGMATGPAKFLSGAMFATTIGHTVFRPAGGAVNTLYAFTLYLHGGAKAYVQGSSDALVSLFDATHRSTAHVPLETAAARHAKLTTAMASHGSDAAALRLGPILALIEMWNLVLKREAAARNGASEREQWELYAAWMATAAAIAITVANVGKALRGEGAWYAHLNLTSGVLGGFAAGVVAVESWQDASYAFRDKRYFAALALRSKSALSALGAAGSMYVGLLYSGPLLIRAKKLFDQNWFGRSALAAGEQLERFARRDITNRALIKLTGKVAVRVGAEAFTGFIGWALIVYQLGELAVWAISDDAAQVWLTRCAFRKPVNDYRGLWGEVVHDKLAGTSYASLDEEIKALEAALSGGA